MFGARLKSKGTFNYNLLAMVYVELKLKRKVDWSTYPTIITLPLQLEDGQRDIPDLYDPSTTSTKEMLVSLKKPDKKSASSSGRVEVKPKTTKLPRQPKAALDKLDEGVENKVKVERVENQVKVEQEENSVHAERVENKVQVKVEPEENKVENTTLQSTATSTIPSIPCKKEVELLPQNPSTLIDATTDSKGKQKLKSDNISKEVREEKYTIGPNWTMTVALEHVGPSNPTVVSPQTPNEKDALDDTDPEIRDRWCWGTCRPSKTKTMTIDDIVIAFDAFVKKVPMPGENAEEEQWNRAEQVPPDFASDLGSLKHLSKELYVNLVRSMDVTLSFISWHHSL